MKNLFAVFVFLSLPAFAEQELQLSGFGTIGTVFSESDIYGDRTDSAQRDGTFEGDFNLSTSSVLGLQLDYVVNSELDFVYQAVYRNQTDIDLDNTTDLAFVRYAPSAEWSFRLGRTTFDIYLLSEYRDVSFAYPWAHIPIETYGVVPYRYIDGADATYTKQFKNFTLSTKFFTGENEVEFFGFTDGVANDTVKLDDIYGLSLDFQSLAWVFKLKYTHVTIASENNVNQIVNGLQGLAFGVPGFDNIWPNAFELSQQLSLKGHNAYYLSASGRYDFNRWSVISEISNVKSSSIVLPDIKTAYISGIYHLGSHSFFGSYSRSRKNNFDLDAQGIDQQALSFIPGGSELYVGVKSILAVSGSNQNTTSIGWRWDFHERIAWKIQWDLIQVEEDGSALLLRDIGVTDLEERFNTVFTNVSFTF